MATVDQGPEVIDDSGLAAVGRHWGIVMGLGVLSIIVGFIVMVWPGKTVVVVAVVVAIWLLVSGIFQIIRGFGGGLTGGLRALLIISGILSIILGLIALRGAFQATEILAILIGIAFLFQGFGQLFHAAEEKGGRGWNIFGGIVMLIGGLVVLVWPGVSLATLAWITGIWLVIGGGMMMIASLQLRSASKAG
jgi:uncharacterized membrane protein HdeD (DUF308 family)